MVGGELPTPEFTNAELEGLEDGEKIRYSIQTWGNQLEKGGSYM